MTTDAFWAAKPAQETRNGVDLHLDADAGVLYVACRATARGAYTTAHGARVAQSASGRHWVEAAPVQIGTPVPITTITNSGRDESFRVPIEA